MTPRHQAPHALQAPQARQETRRETLAALALLSLIALGAAQALSVARARLDEAAQVQDATALASQVLDELALVGWHGLPARFGSKPSHSEASLDSTRDGVPRAWQQALEDAELPDATLLVTLEGLGEGGARRAFEASVGLRIVALVDWRTRRGPRSIRLVGARF